MRRIDQGDTIVEVLLAMTLLTAVLFGSWAIVNRSTQISLAARQRITMVNQLKEQAEIIKSMYANPSTSGEIANRKFGGTTAKLTATPLTQIHLNPCQSTRGGSGQINSQNPVNGFHFGDTGAVSSINEPKTISGLDNAKVWVQVASGTGYLDFYIRGCWPAPGGTQKEENTQLVMRLNT